MKFALEASGLSKRYRTRWALRECSFALPTGRIAALVGQNGAGKTTLLHIAVGLLSPTSGEVQTLGAHPPLTADLMSRVGFVAQDTPLYRSFTVDDLLSFGKHTNAAWDDDGARSRLERLEIPFDQRAGALSGGQRAQVALALALAKRPDILLLDEPLASLDPLARREFLQTLMEAVVEDDITVLLSSHLIADLERVCDHLLILANGRLQIEGPIEDLLDEHKVLIGPRRRSTRTSKRTNNARAKGTIAGVSSIVSESGAGRQSTLLVRTQGRVLDPAWDVQDVSLEDLVLAYLGRKGEPAPEDNGVQAITAGRSR